MARYDNIKYLYGAAVCCNALVHEMIVLYIIECLVTIFVYVIPGQKLLYWTKLDKMANWWPSNISYRNVNWGENKPRLDELVQIMEAFNQQLENTSSGSGDNGSQVGSDEEESDANIDIESQDGNGCEHPEDEMETKCIKRQVMV